MKEAKPNTKRIVPFIILALLVTGGALFGMIKIVHAISFEEPSGTFGLATADLRVTIIRFINWALGLLGIIATVMMLWGGYVWMTAAGNEQKVKQAKKILLNAAIGLVVVLLAWSLINFVFRLGESSGGGDVPPTTCTPGDTMTCYICVASGSGGTWVLNPGDPDPSCHTEERFEIMDIVTSCVNPPNDLVPGGEYRDDVFRCSAVSVLFNHPVAEPTVPPRIADDSLTVEECDPSSDFNNCNNPTQPSPLFGSAPDEIAYSGPTPTGTKAEFVLNGNALNFVHAHELYNANTYYRLTIPRNVSDLGGNNIKFTQEPSAVNPEIPCVPSNGVAIPGCVVTLTEVQWIFRVGSETDTTAPTMVSTYPRSDIGQVGYPDRNINRVPSIAVTFSEPVASWTVTHANVIIAPVTGSVNADGSGGTVGAPIVNSNYGFSHSPTGFQIGWLNGFQLDPFVWYEITVKDITDMCSNVQSPSSLSWRFQTNGVGPGVAEMYPSDGALWACPLTPIFVRFNTSMYDPFNHSCTPVPVIGGYVESGTIAPGILRVFNVADPVPAGGIPDDSCKKYHFYPTTTPGELAVSTNYTVDVNTRYVMNADGDTLRARWSFTTGPANQCANQPYIDHLSPDTGEPGRCIGVIGDHFDEVAPFGAGPPNDHVTFDNTPVPDPDIRSWTQYGIATFAPSTGSGTQDVRVSVEYPSPIGTLTSNARPYTFAGTSYDGPCLYSLSPPTGFRNQNFDLIGERFDPLSPTKVIHFLDQIDGDIGGPRAWSSDTVANMIVPSTASQNRTALISLENSKGTSNELPFFVSQIPATTFQVIDQTPVCLVGGACPNADVRARFSQSLDPPTVTPGSTTGQGNVELYTCPDPSCATVTPADRVNTGLSSNPYVPSSLDVHFPEDPNLQQNRYYRAVIRGGSAGVRSESGSKELGGLNYDLDGDGTLDSYSWTFLSAPTATNCALDAVECQPNSASIPIGGDRLLSTRARSAPNTCNPAGEELDPTAFPWTWSSSSAAVSLSSVGPQSTTTAHGDSATASPVAVTARTGTEQNQCLISVTTTGCVVDADCHPLGSCTGSSCVAGTCSPTIENINPVTGAVGDWVTVSGCYFGNYVSGLSTVTFLQNAGGSDDLTALWPSPATCGVPGSTWSDSQIVIEVPNKSTASPADDVVNPGPLEVMRGTDGVGAVSTDLFTPVGGPQRPGICAVDPPGGTPSVTIAKIWGQNFGTSQTAGTDRAVFYNLQDVPPSDTPFWSETRVEARVPLNAANAPAGPPENGRELYLENDSLQSNAVNFDILPIGCTTCSADTSCAAGGATEGCGQVGPFQCCISRPTVNAAAPTGNNVCRNAAITFSFVDAATTLPKAMDLSTITPSTVHLFNVTDGSAVTLAQNQIGFPSNRSVEIAPGLLGRNKQYRITISGDNDLTDGIAQGVLSTDRIGLNGDISWVFTSADEDNFCRIGFIRLDPDSYSFTALSATATANARAYDTDGTTQIMPINSIYDWTWQWGTDQTAIASVTNTNAPQQTLTANSKGETVLHLTAQAGTGWTGSRTARARVVVDACNAPWPAAPPLLDDAAHYPARSKHTNFSTWYCRDEGALPPLNIIEQEGAVAANAVDEKLREFFFENPNVNPLTSKKDAIGILVWENEKELSAPAWYRKKFNKSVGTATSKVDGYDAMRVGTTVYIAGTNLAGGTLYTNMYVLGYNEDAGPDTVAIFNQILARLRLNANENDFVYGSTDALTARDQVRLDMRRKSSMNDYVGALVAYNAKKGVFPRLDAGSYITGISTSKWPSWTGTLGAELSANVPDRAINAVDPVNAFSASPTPCTAVPGFDAETCWNEATKSFVCPAGSHVYGYRSADGSWFNLYAHFDYEGTGTWSTGSADLCDAADGSVAPASCSAQCFNYRFHGTPSTVVGIPASNVLENGGVGGSVAGAAAPVAPQKVAARAGGANAVTVTWEAVSEEADIRYYRVLRGGDDGVQTVVAQTRHPSSSYTDATVKAGKQYAYAVMAIDYFGGASAPSDPAAVTLPESGDALPPHSVSDVTIALQGKQLVFSWKNPSDRDFGGVLLVRKPDAAASFRQNDEGTEKVADLKPTATTTSLRSADEPTERVTYGLFAYDDAGNVAPGVFVTRGTVSAEIEKRPEPLARVRNLTAVADDRGSVLTWLLPDDKRVIGVMIRRSSQPPQSAEEGELVATIPAPQTRATDTAVRGDGQTWYAAFSTDAAGAASEPITVDLGGNATHGDVRAFRARPGDGYVLLTWERTRMPTADRMVIRRSSSAFPTSADDGEPVTTLSPRHEGAYTDRAVRNGTIYYYSAFLGGKGNGFAKARPEKSTVSLSALRIPVSTIETERVVLRWTTNVPATTVVQIGTSPQYELGSFMLGEALTDHAWDSALFGLRLTPNTAYHVRALSSDAVGGRAASANRVVVTDLRLSDGRVWEGYDETLTAASWNGSRHAGTCDASCNQYYRCAADGVPDCGDPRNGSADLPGASTVCGALAYADCLDGRVDLPQGQKVLTPSVLRGWAGSRLPLAGEYATACTSPGAPTGMPYPKGVWTADATDQPGRAGVAGAGADGASCRATSADTVSALHSLMIFTPTP